MAAHAWPSAGFIDHPGTTHAEILASGKWQVKRAWKREPVTKDCANMRMGPFMRSQDHFCGRNAGEVGRLNQTRPAHTRRRLEGQPPRQTK